MNTFISGFLGFESKEVENIFSSSIVQYKG